MKIWIDLANAPHVPFFLPIIRELERRGNEVDVSFRDFNQTVELAKKNGIEGSVIGTHGGKSQVGKVLNLFDRAFQLAGFGRREAAEVAVSHNSYTQTIAGRLTRARVVTIMDYEGQPANHIAFRLAHKVIVPSAFPEADLRRFGCPESRVLRYEGFKEQVYLSDFTPSQVFPGELSRACELGEGWDIGKTVLVTVRTPASLAAYHPFENVLFEKLLGKLEKAEGVTVILLPRTADQRGYYKRTFPRLKQPREPLSGNNLMFYSDLVVSAGGTMNREAAVLGTPVCTIFAGKLPAVDERLIEMGRMTAIKSETDIETLMLQKKKPGNVLNNPGLCGKLVDWITTA
jgi:uncharacterized protein